LRNPPNDTGQAIAENPPSRPREGKGKHVPERSCVLSREAAPREGLIRLALSPDGEILPDVRAKAPGRGAWIGVDRAALDKALASGKLKGALARAFKTNDIRIPDDLSERIASALRQSVLDRLGLEARAGTLVSGAEKIETAARKGDVHLLLHAADAGEDGNRRLDQAMRVGGAGEQGLVFPAQRAILSLALGRQNVVHIAMIDRAAAQRVRHALGRWCAFIGAEVGLSAVSAATPDAPDGAGRNQDLDEGIE
jgi:predicted RNA-binding protein YlxR (DUF448 family)